MLIMDYHVVSYSPYEILIDDFACCSDNPSVIKTCEAAIPSGIIISMLSPADLETLYNRVNIAYTGIKVEK
jgi:hypothetical protein